MSKSKKNDFNAELNPFADLYSEMSKSICEILETKSDEELSKILEYTKELSMTNCWWCTYEVAPIVRHEAQITLSMRKSIEKAHELAKAEGTKNE